MQLPSPQVLKALTIQILELNAKPYELRIYCSKEEITKELKINPVKFKEVPELLFPPAMDSF